MKTSKTPAGSRTRTLGCSLILCFSIGWLGSCANAVDEQQENSTAPSGQGQDGSGGSASQPNNPGSGSSGAAPVLGSNPSDRDGDGLPVDWENQYGLSDADPTDAFLDSDSDYLANLREYQLGLNPLNPDSDGDQMPDGVEVDIQSDPLHADGVTVVTVCADACDYTLISAALAAGAFNINVKPGVYRENIVIGSSRHVFSQVGAAKTVINAAIADHVVTMNRASSLHGFTISGGSAASGGGIYASMGVAVIRANIVENNQAVVDANNVNSGYGGGIFIYYDSNATLKGRVIGNDIHDNAALWGAGVDAVDYSYVAISENRIHHNLASVAPASNGSTAYQAMGGGIFLSNYANAYCFNNVFYGNEARDGKGGGIYAGLSNVVLNNTVVANSAPAGSGVSSTSVLIGNIIWNNLPADVSIDAVLLMHYSIVNGGFANGVGNLNSDPLFINESAFDFRLQSGSPAIDNGSRGVCTGNGSFSPCLDSMALDQLLGSGWNLNRDLIGADRALDGDAKGTVSGDGSDYDIGAVEYIPPPQ